MRLMLGDASDVTFSKHIPKGTGPVEPGAPTLLVAESEISHWGIVRSVEMAVYRDGTPAKDIGLYSLGIREQGTKTLLKFQLQDKTNVVEHDYRVEAKVHFCPGSGSEPQK